jgi:hypothetical protein
MRLVGWVLQRRTRRVARDWWLRRAEVRAAGARGGRVGVKRGEGVGGGRAAEGSGCGYVADVFCAASGAGLGREKRATYAGDVRPAASRRRRASSPRGADGRRNRDIRGQDGGESTSDLGVAVAGLNDDANGGRRFGCATLPKCHEVRRRRLCARFQRKRYCAGGEEMYLDIYSLALEHG